MTTKIISGTITGGYTLSSAYDALSITSGGLITGATGVAGTGGASGYFGGAGGAAVELPLGGMVANSGSIDGGTGGRGALRGGAGGAGVALAQSGAVANYGLIEGGVGGRGHRSGAGGVGVQLAALGTVDNSGSILGGAGYFSWYFAGAGGAGVVLLSGGTIANSGSIRGGEGNYSEHVNGNGGAGVVLVGAGEVSSGGTISGGAGGSGDEFFEGDGGNGGVGVVLTEDGTISNTGVIEGGQGGYSLRRVGMGGAGISMSRGGAIFNTGSITGGGGSYGFIGNGVILTSGGSVVNGSATSTSAVISGHVGVFAGSSAPATVINYGTIDGARPDGNRRPGGDAVELGGGGYLVNGSVASNAALIVGSAGVFAGPSGAATVANFGTIESWIGSAVRFQNRNDRLVVEAGSKLIGEAKGGGGTLELGSGVTLISGSATSVNGFRFYQIDAGASLEVDSRGASTFTATFAGESASLALTMPGNLKATLAGFAAGDTIDLLNTAATGARVNQRTNRLIVLDGTKTVATFRLSGDYAGATFTTSSDGNGGTDVTLAVGRPSPLGLSASMAGLGASATFASAAPAAAAGESSTQILLGPRG